MMETQKLGAEGQSLDKIRSITDGATVVGGPVDVAVSSADGGFKVELGSGFGRGEMVKRKRGRPPKAMAKPPPAKKNKEVVVEEEEDVCFICFDGGSLVLCDRRGCPKAYHPACIKRDEAFFESAAKWNCGWHICSICQKTAHHMCYTCTYSLCRSCIKKADYVCVRGEKGFCTICMKTIMLIENNGQGEDGKVQADFDDKLSWEYLFKVYWIYLKGKLSLTLDELKQAKNPWKLATTITATATTTATTTTTISSPLPSTVINNTANDLISITSASSVGNIEENESKRRKLDDQIDVTEKPVITEKPLITEKPVITEKPMTDEWATKELLDFVSHMKNGNTSVLSYTDVQALITEYINNNNLRDPRKKNQVICDSRLMILFGKPRVGHIQMRKLLEHHLFIKEDIQKSKVVRSSVVKNSKIHDDDEWSPDNNVVVGKSRKLKNRNKGEERVLQNKLDEFAAVDVHNMNLIYLRRDLTEILLEDSGSFDGKVVGSIVRIKISGENDLYRLVQVVGTSKVDVAYKVNSKLTDVMLEVLNLDKKETIAIDTISDQEFSEEECRRLKQSIKCGLVKHFTVGEIQEKAVALQPVKLNDLMEKEILRLNHICDATSEKGQKKKGYKECMEKLQILKTPEERERRLQEIPQVHSDPKMNPHYESDDTEEYFNKEHVAPMESKHLGVSGKTLRSPKKRSATLSKKTDQQPNHLIMEEKPKIHVEKVATVSTSGGKLPNEVDLNDSIITKLDQQAATLSSSVSITTPQVIPAPPVASSLPNELMWHYLDPNGKVQGPFSLIQLQRWSTTGYFPSDMRVWPKTHDKDKSLLLNDVLKQHFHKYDITTGNKVANNQTEGGVNVNVSSATPSSTVDATPVTHEKSSDGRGSTGQSFGQNWNANSNLNSNSHPTIVSLTESNEQLETAVPTPSKDANTTVFELPGPTPKTVHEEQKTQPVLDSKIVIQDSGNPASWSSASSLVVGETKLPVDGWGGQSSSTLVKREEWDSFKPLEITDHVATPTSNIDQNIDQNIQPTCNDVPTWHGMGEMIEFQTLAEESVSDLLAEVDAMESQYGLPSPTSRRNSFVDDLFNGSFDEFSPTPDQGTRSDGFSSSGDIQLPCQSTTTTDEHLAGSSQLNNNINININAFDFMKTSYSVGVQPPTENIGFKWPDMERVELIDINRSVNAEGEEGEMETKTDDVQVKVKVENGSYANKPFVEPDTCHNPGVVQVAELKSSGEPQQPMQAPRSISTKLASKADRSKVEEEGEFIQPEASQPKPPLPPPPPPPLTLGLDPFDPSSIGSETMQGKPNHSGRSGQGTNPNPNLNPYPSPTQQRYNNSPRGRNHQVTTDSGYSRNTRSSWNKQQQHASVLGSGGGGRPPVKGQRVCRFYESGRCKKGASCKYLHP